MNEEVLKHFKSMCPDCRGKGHIVAMGGNINLCIRCNTKGYQTYEELENEVEKLGKAQRQK